MSPTIGPAPRIYTPPLRELTPATSKGFAVCDWVERHGVTLMPWQRRAYIHGLELHPDGGYRFETVLVTAARQNGKTTIPRHLVPWRMLHDGARLCLWTSTILDYAREAWEASVEWVEEELPEHVAKVRRGSINTSLLLDNGARSKIATSNRSGGRSLPVDLGIADELREHRSWAAWAALSGATTARPGGQLWALSNAGDDESVVLNQFRDSAIAHIETGDGDDSLCLLEWSAPEDADLADLDAWRLANPALGITITERTLRSKLAKVPPELFRTEHMNTRVPGMDTAIDPAAWRDGADPTGNMDAYRDRVFLAVEASLDLQHVALVAAARTDDDRYRVEVVAAWDSTRQALAELPPLLHRIRPQATGWLPSGPTTALAAGLRDRQLRNITEVKTEVPGICMAFSDLVSGRRIVHNGDPLLTAQIGKAVWVNQGDQRRYGRRGGQGHVNAVYAAATAVHLARTTPPRPKLVVLSAG